MTRVHRSKPVRRADGGARAGLLGACVFGACARPSGAEAGDTGAGTDDHGSASSSSDPGDVDTLTAEEDPSTGSEAGASTGPDASDSVGMESDESGADGSAGSGDCTFEVDAEISERIVTVGIVEWSITDGRVESATIEYGLDTDYDLQAPVDLEEPGFRTLLLGMKGDRVYHFRIVARVGGERCVSEDHTLTTGMVPNTLVVPDVEENLPGELARGYMISGFWGTSEGPAFIMDADKDFVWYYPFHDDVMRTRMTYDGKGMWIRNTAQTNGTGRIRRVSLDGLREEVFDLGDTTHDLAVTPHGTIGLIAHNPGNCDEIAEFDPQTGTLTTIFNGYDAHGQTTCHMNSLHYHAADDSFWVSDWTHSVYIKVHRETKALAWVVNGERSDFEGTDWTYQHGLHLLGLHHFLVFSNGGQGRNSIVYEYKLDTQNMIANEVWRYDGGVSAQFGGDVQRLSNGNTLVTYSSAGLIHEVNEDREIVQKISWPLGTTVAYVMYHDSLYETPQPKVH